MLKAWLLGLTWLLLSGCPGTPESTTTDQHDIPTATQETP